MRSETNHFRYLDSLRGLAILSVILVHSCLLTVQKGLSATIGLTGQRGVQLFYIISAFTLCLSLDSRKQEYYELSNYFLRRFFRVAPMFYFAICANLALIRFVPVWNPNSPISKLDILAGFLFLNGTMPRSINSVAIGGWSIAIETTFYLFLPMLYRRLLTVTQAAIWFAISAVILGSLSWQLASHSSDEIHRTYFAFLWFPVELPIFILGILAYRLWQKYVRSAVLDSGQRRELSICLLVGSALVYQGCLPFGDQTLYGSSLLFMLLLLALALHPWPILVNRFTMFIGQISYSLYLVHFFVILFAAWCLQRLHGYAPNFCARHIYGSLFGWALAYLFILGLSVPICMVTWRLVEQPGMRVGRWIIRQRENVGARATAELIGLNR